MLTNLFSGKSLENLPYIFFHQVRFPKDFSSPQKHAILKIPLLSENVGFWLESDAFVACCFFRKKANKDLWQMPKMTKMFPKKSLQKLAKQKTTCPVLMWNPKLFQANVKNGSSRWFLSHLKNVSLVWSFLQVRVKINTFETTTYLSKFILLIHTPGKEFEFEGRREHYLYADVTTRYLWAENRDCADQKTTISSHTGWILITPYKWVVVHEIPSQIPMFQPSFSSGLNLTPT